MDLRPPNYSPKPSKSVFIIIINWNDVEMTLSCLESVFSSTYQNLQTIVLDNASEVDPENAFVSRFPSIIYVRNNQNKGYTGANNQGISIALDRGADYVWLLNNDATVHEDAISKLVNCMESTPSLGMSSPVLIDSSPHKVNYYGSFMNPVKLRYFPAKTPEEFMEKSKQNPQEVLLVGAALFIRSAALSQVGLLDEDYFAYYEDFDISLRMNRAGWQNSVCFPAVVYHQNSKPDRLPHYFYYMARNGLLFVKKNATKKMRNRLVRGWFAYNIKRAANHIAESKKEDANAILDGIWNAIRGQYGSYEQRKPIPSWLKTFLLSHPYFLAKISGFSLSLWSVKNSQPN